MEAPAFRARRLPPGLGDRLFVVDGMIRHHDTWLKQPTGATDDAMTNPSLTGRAFGPGPLGIECRSTELRGLPWFG